jgi:hypothetical protein
MPMPRLAYLSMDSLDAFECYDHLTFAPLRSLGHEVEEVPWRGEEDWDGYDYVIIRSPWDYQDDAQAFLDVLECIDGSAATLLNPLDVVRWNIDKRYLRELEQRGAAIVPTLWSESLVMDQLREAGARFSGEELIVKPAVSANADDTFRIPLREIDAFAECHLGRFHDRPCLLQPFLPAILSEGEYSLFYFAGQLSHCILKTPKDRDFRVQEEHGGRLSLVKAPQAELLGAGDRVLKAIGQSLLYARLDFVRCGQDFLLMEAELIEPSLYFNMDTTSPERFARAFDAWHRAAPGA